MSQDYSSFVEGYDDASPDHGYMPEPLPLGEYPVRVERIISKRDTKNGVPSAGVLLRVTEGPLENRTALVTLYLGASSVKRNKDNQEVERSPEEIDKARAKVQGMMAGLLKSVGLSKGDVAGLDSSSPDFVYGFYRIDDLPGREFMAGITKRQDNNNLSAYWPLDDPSHGLEAWRREVLPKQEAAFARNKQASSSGGAQRL